MHFLTKQEWRSLLHDAGFAVDIPSDVGLALKADLVLPWWKLYDEKCILATHAG